MKKILALSTIVSALSLAHSVNTYTEYKYDNESKVALGSDLKIDFKNITGESKIKFGEFGFEDSVFLNFQKNIDFKNEYNLRLNVAKNVDFVGKVKFDVEKRDKTDKINYEIEPAFEIAHKDFKFLLGLNEKGTKETFDTGVKLGVDYAKSGFENKFRLGAWYLTNRGGRSVDLAYGEIIRREQDNDIKIIGMGKFLGKSDAELMKMFIYTNPKVSVEAKVLSEINVPFEISAVDNINYSKGKFETKNEINVNYLNNDLHIKYKVPSVNPAAELKDPILATQKNQENTLKVKVKSENSYKATDTLTPKFNVENEFIRELKSNEALVDLNHYEVVLKKTETAYTPSDIKLNSLKTKDLFYNNSMSNKTNIKLALNYTKQIDSKNKFSVEPSLATEILYTFNLEKGVMSVDNKLDSTESHNLETTLVNNRKISYSLVPKIEGTYENKINDNLTFALKPFIELNFAGSTTGGNYRTYKVDNERFVNDVKMFSSNDEEDKKLKDLAKQGKKVKYGVTETTKTPFVYNSVKAGAKLELNYTW